MHAETIDNIYKCTDKSVGLCSVFPGAELPVYVPVHRSVSNNFLYFTFLCFFNRYEMKYGEGRQKSEEEKMKEVKQLQSQV